MNNDTDGQQPAESGPPDPQSLAAQDKLVAARRRFLRAGAAGSTAMVMTVVHQRAFAANGKKASTASNCVSMMGIPDLKNVKNKKALETSAMGSPKGLICRPRPPAVDPNPVGACTQGLNGSGPNHWSKYLDANGNQFYTASDDLKNGCGNLTLTTQASYNTRLYDEGFCPIVYDATNKVLYYDTTKKYYDRSAPTVAIPCQWN